MFKFTVARTVLAVLTLWGFTCLAYMMFIADVFDIRFLSYQAYTVKCALTLMLLYTHDNFFVFKRLVLFVLPIMFTIQLFIATAILVIVHVNDNNYLKSTVVLGAMTKVGFVHTGDIVLHYIPVFETMVIYVVLLQQMRKIVHMFFKMLDTRYKVMYVVYLTCSATAILLLYCIGYDFLKNYPSGLDVSVIIGLLVGVSVLIAGLKTAILLLM